MESEPSWWQQNWSLKGFQETGVLVAVTAVWTFPYERRMILIDIDLHMLVTKRICGKKGTLNNDQGDLQHCYLFLNPRPQHAGVDLQSLHMAFAATFHR